MAKLGKWPDWQELEQRFTLDVNTRTVGHTFFHRALQLGKALFIETMPEDDKTLLKQLDLLLAVAWEHLNTGHWKDVPLPWRYFYSYVSLFKAKAAASDPTVSLKALDMGILMGAPICDGLLPRIAANLHERLCRNDFPGEELIDAFANRENIPVLQKELMKNQSELKRFKNLSVADFMLNNFQSQVPCIIEGLAQEWPAFSRWRKLSYFRKVCGNRTVPIEVGRRYTDSDWGQKLMTVSKFFDDFILTRDEKINTTGYLAQHQLFDQIAELKNDIVVPDFCFVPNGDDDDDEDTRVEINAWLGPKTVSPLHQDPKDNILVQVTGGKYVHLFDWKETEFLYPFETDRLLSNTSQIDLLDVDLTKFPDFTKAKSGLFGILEPSDALYIPKKWWHFVSSLSDWSCSVSFWF